MNERAKAILYFWFEQSSHKERFSKNAGFDQKIRDKFFDDYQKAVNNEYDYWQDNINECLALVILLDQFSRNLFRNNGNAFVMDKKVRQISAKALVKGYHKQLTEDQIIFLFLPFMHSEELSDQMYCVKLINIHCQEHANYKNAIKYAQLHLNIIKKFKRFPYRNKVLQRQSTKEEEEYLNSTYLDFFNI